MTKQVESLHRLFIDLKSSCNTCQPNNPWNIQRWTINRKTCQIFVPGVKIVLGLWTCEDTTLYIIDL
jgi:hypothetical protein